MISYLLITEGYFIFIGPVKYMNEGVPSFFFFFFFFFFLFQLVQFLAQYRLQRDHYNIFFIPNIHTLFLIII